MVTGLYAAILTFFFIGLSIYVIKGRRLFRIALGDAHNMKLKRRIRAHANFAEYSCFFILLMGLAEHNATPYIALHIFGIIFLSGRLSHAYSLLQDETYNTDKVPGQVNLNANPLYRITGMICTFITLGTLSALLIFQFIQGL